MGTNDPGGSHHEFILETTLQYRVQPSWKSHCAQRRTGDNKSTPGTILANTFRENKLPTESDSSTAVTDARGQWDRIFKVLRGNKCQQGILRYHSRLREKHKQLGVHTNWELITHRPRMQEGDSKRGAWGTRNDEGSLSFAWLNLHFVPVPREESHIFPSGYREKQVVPPPVLWKCLLLKDACRGVPPLAFIHLAFDTLTDNEGSEVLPHPRHPIMFLAATTFRSLGRVLWYLFSYF